MYLLCTNTKYHIVFTLSTENKNFFKLSVDIEALWCYIMFTQDENGEADVVTSVMLPYAYAAANAGIMAYYALSCYYGVDVPQSVFFDTDTNIIINE